MKQVLIAAGVTLTLIAAACAGGAGPVAPTDSGSGSQPSAADGERPTPNLSLTTAPVEEVEIAIYRAEPYVQGVVFPVALAFAPDGSLYVAEKGGAVRVLSPEGALQAEPVYTVAVDASGERGLLGLALDPAFDETGYVWVYYTAADALVNRVARFSVHGGVGGEFQDAFEAAIAFETSTILNGGGLHFGPDGMLYISVGSTNNVYVVNEPDSPQGKLHRVTPTIPVAPAPDNPNPASTIYARGLRNMFDFTFHPDTGWIFGTENGGDCDDEVNLIVPGGHYGWREDGLCEDNNLPADYPYVAPLIYYTPPLGMTGIDFYRGDVFPEWQGDMLYCSWHGARLVRVKWNEDFTRIINSDILETGPAHCRVDVLTGPDGYIYFTDLTTIYRLARND